MNPLTISSGDGACRNNHFALPIWILLVASILGGSIVLIVARALERHFSLAQYYSLGCTGFLIAWWIVYFNYKRQGIASLRQFLEDKNPYRTDGLPVSKEPIQRDEDTNVVTKATFSVGAQGIFIAIIALFLGLVLDATDLNPFQELLRPVIAFLALLTILMMVVAIDILDTAANLYSHGWWTPFRYRHWFNSRIGPAFPKGGASYAYTSFALFSAFIIIGLMFFYPLLAGYGIAMYAYLSYPFLYGYKVVDSEGEPSVEIDDKAGMGSLVVGGIPFVLTLAIGLME